MTVAPPPTRAEERGGVAAAWHQAGFGHQQAVDWQHAGWRDPGTAAAWMTASPGDDPGHLRMLHDAGYSPDQLRQARRVARRHVAAWTAALLPPAQGGRGLGYDRAVVAHCVLARHDPRAAIDTDAVIDLR